MTLSLVTLSLSICSRFNDVCKPLELAGIFVNVYNYSWTPDSKIPWGMLVVMLI